MSGTAAPPIAFFPNLPVGFRWGVAFIWQPTRNGHQDDSAPGEAFRTSWGIIQTTWDTAVHAGIVTGDLVNATQAQAGNIYLANFWNAMRLDALPPAVGFVLFCDATLVGPGGITLLLQRIIGMDGSDIDGVIGDKTLAAAHAYLLKNSQTALIDNLIAADEAYLATLSNAPKFLNGWTRREEEEKVVAHQIVALDIPTVAVVTGVGSVNKVAVALPVTALPIIAPVAPPAPVAPAMLEEGDWLVSVKRVPVAV